MGAIITPVAGWHEEEFVVRNRHEWLEVHVATKGSAIKLKINSSFGAMGYTWGSCGKDVDWRTWLEDTDFQYFMGKMFGDGYRQFSYEKTLACMKENVMESYDFHELDEKMEEFQDLEDQEDHSEHAVVSWMQDNLDLIGWDDWWHMICKEDRPDLRAFWTEMWRPFIEGVQR